MTAAYTDDPTIAEERSSEKRIARNSPGSERRSGRREVDDDNSGQGTITLEGATGGQDKEATTDAARCPTDSCVPVADAESVESRENNALSDHEILKSENGVLKKGIHEATSGIESMFLSSGASADRITAASTKSGISAENDDALYAEGNSRIVSPSARGVETTSRTINSGCGFRANEAPRMQEEPGYSLGNANAEEFFEENHEGLPGPDESVISEEDGEENCDPEGEENYDFDGEESYDPEGEQNFHEAVRAGDAKCVAALLACGSVQNLDEPDWNVSGDPPLLVAATNHCLPVLSLLLANGSDPGVRSPRGETALHRVILNGGPGNVFKFVGELLKYGCPPGVKEAGGGLTALHVLTRQLAHAQGSKNLHHNFEAALKTLDLLAKAGPINAKDHQGRSALHILASSTIFDNSHRTEIQSLIETLLAAGADPSLKNDRGETPLHECLECGALNTAFLLIAHTPTGITSRYGETPLHIASRKNYADMVAKLLEHGEDPSIQDAGGNTPLHLASARGFHQTVSLLVTSPLAQLEKLNIDGLTALQVAAESGFVNAVRLLLKAGADPSHTMHYCTTTLHRHPDISVLIDHELSRRRQLAA